VSGQAVFYKAATICLISSRAVPFSPGAYSAFYMQCLLCLRSNPEYKFVFCEVHLKAKLKNQEERCRSAAMLLDYFGENFQDLPVIVAGDFNEDPYNEPI